MRSALGLLALWVALAVSLDVSAQAQTSEIAVIVRDGAGRPVSGAEVVAVSGDWRTVATDGGGQVRLQVTPGTWEVMVLHGELPSSRQPRLSPSGPVRVRGSSFARCPDPLRSREVSSFDQIHLQR